MDVSSLFFVVLMVAIGGVSAYVADILGYKIGKKRLSIKRIRPKYVARISVVIAGMLIPIITMALLYAASSDFRTWLTRGSQVVKDLELKSKEVEKINIQLKDGETRNAQLKNQNEINQERFSKKKKEADEQEKKVSELNGKVANLNTSIGRLNSNIESIKREKVLAQAQLEPLRKSLEALNLELPKVRGSLNAANDKLKDAESKYKDATKNYNSTTTKNLELTSANGELQAKNLELKKVADDLQIVIDNVNKDLESLKSQKALAVLETAKVQANLERESAKLKEAKDTLDSIRLIFRSQPISYLRGEEVTRLSFRAKPTVSEAAGTFRSLLRRARSLASDHGAKSDPDYPFSGSAGMIVSDANNRALTEADVEKYWVDQMRDFGKEGFLLAKTYENRFVSEPVTLQIDILPNPLVFRKGEIVTESKIDGRISEIEILNGIREFLRTFVNTKARQRNMIPVQARDGLSYGEFSQDQLLKTVAKVKAVPRISRLVAVAKQDIRAGDSLDIDIEVR